MRWSARTSYGTAEADSLQKETQTRAPRRGGGPRQNTWRELLRQFRRIFAWTVREPQKRIPSSRIYPLVIWRSVGFDDDHMRTVEPVGRHRPAHFPALEVFNRSTAVFLTVCTKDRKP